MVRRHNDSLAIFVTLVVIDLGIIVAVPFILLFGIGLLICGALIAGWFKCLIWACTGDTMRRDRRVAMYHADAIADVAFDARRQRQIAYDNDYYDGMRG
jgi:hypothetical protein